MRRLKARESPTPRSLVWATTIDVLPLTHVVARGDGYLAVRSPSSPGHYWGNFLLFDEPPGAGDRVRWERLFEREFAVQPASEHRAFGWEVTDGRMGAAQTEFLECGYILDRVAGMVAAPEEIRPHPRADRSVEVRALRPEAGTGDEPLWRQVVELWVSSRDAEYFAEAPHRTYSQSRLADLRVLFQAGRGAWYVALIGEEVAGSCGVVVTEGRGRFQAVDVKERYRGRGICTRLVTEAAAHASEDHGATHLVIAADPDYHAIDIYRSVGFTSVEQVTHVCLQPATDRPLRPLP